MKIVVGNIPLQAGELKKYVFPIAKKCNENQLWIKIIIILLQNMYKFDIQLWSEVFVLPCIALGLPAKILDTIKLLVSLLSFSFLLLLNN